MFFQRSQADTSLRPLSKLVRLQVRLRYLCIPNFDEMFRAGQKQRVIY